MELMESSLDKFYKFVYGELQSSIPEDILGKITVAVSIVYLLFLHSPFILLMSDSISLSSIFVVGLLAYLSSHNPTFFIGYMAMAQNWRQKVDGVK